MKNIYSPTHNSEAKTDRLIIAIQPPGVEILRFERLRKYARSVLDRVYPGKAKIVSCSG
ncbi:MAG: hypothetical protein K8T10_02435 [Candidatus Eremiobacteraeota bacterium]|nr:hypothetical protein [Candidatus Eremiobacteraeota bacterium]